jgi:plastocyanin
VSTCDPARIRRSLSFARSAKWAILRLGPLATSILLLAVITGSGAQQGGTIRGRVKVERQPLVLEPRPGVSDLGGPSVAAPAEREPYRSVVYLESAPLGAFEEPRRPTAVMNQRNEAFVPHVLAIMVGTTVEFPNSDRIYHNVFSLSKPARFDLGRYANGRSKSVRFDQPGIVRVFCEIHSQMNAYILVFSHPFFAMTDADGRYRLEGVPAGTYNVIAWNEGVALSPRSVSVADGGTADLDFIIR